VKESSEREEIWTAAWRLLTNWVGNVGNIGHVGHAGHVGHVV